MKNKPLELMGAPGSPYTRKMLALLRFRGIAYKVEWQNGFGIQKGRPQAKVPLLPTFYFATQNGQEEAVTDSTPLIRRFEQEYLQRSVIPYVPELAFINYIIEDYADEWLTKAMFHYRWYYKADIDKAGTILPRWRDTTASEAEIQPLSEYIKKRQIDRLRYVGSNSTTKPVIEKGFQEFLRIFNEKLTISRFLFGERPSSADFAIYGQLTSLAHFDPTPAAIVLNNYPRIYAWTEIMEDLSGYTVNDDDSQWLNSQVALNELKPLLAEIGRVYFPYLKANYSAIAAGNKDFQTTLDGASWEQGVFPYQAKCVRAIVDTYAALAPNDQEKVSKTLQESGLMPLIEFVEQGG